jgi:hypothetical protein
MHLDDHARHLAVLKFETDEQNDPALGLVAFAPLQQQSRVRHFSRLYAKVHNCGRG